MSQSPEPNGPRAANPRPFWAMLLGRPVLAGLLVLGVLAGGAIWRALLFIEQELIPTIETSVTKLLDRPVKLGPLRRYSLTELEFGRSELPAQTAPGKIDRDRATAEAVVVKFNPLSVLLDRTLPLDVTLVKPQAFLDEAPNGRWIGTQLQQLPETGWLKIRLDTLRVDEGTVTLDPARTAQRVLQDVNGAVTLRDNNQKIEFRGTSRVDSGGKAAVNGTWLAKSQKLAITAKTEALVIPPLVGFLPPSPIDEVKLRNGEFEGRVQVLYQPNQPLRVATEGTVNRPEANWAAYGFTGQAKQAKGNLTIELREKQQPILRGRVDVDNAIASVPENLLLYNKRQRPLTLRNTQGTFNFLGVSQRMKFNARGNLARGGQIRARGEVELPLKQANIALQLQNVSAALMDKAFELPIEVKSGQANANVQLRLRPGQRPYVLGTAALAGVTASIAAIPQPFRDTNGFLRFRGLTTTLDRLKTRYGDIPLEASGTVDPDRGYALTAQTDAIDVKTALSTLNVKALPVPVVGKIVAKDIQVTGAIQTPVLTGSAVSLGTATVDRIPFSEVSGQFRLELPQLTVSNIVAKPQSGGTVTGKVVSRLDETPYPLQGEFTASGMSGNAIAKLYGDPGFELGNITGTAILTGSTEAPKTAIQFQAPAAAYPAEGRVTVYRDRTVLEQIVAKVKGGVLNLSGLIAAGQVKAKVNIPGILMTAYSPELRGTLTGILDVNGPLSGFSSQTARAQGNVRFSRGLSLIEDPLNAAIQWDGRDIVVDRATATGFQARGRIGADLQGEQGPQLTTLNLAIATQRFNLQKLPTFGEFGKPLYGTADLNGQLSGTITAPRLAAGLVLNQLAANQLAFEPVMRGRMDYDTAKGLNLNLSGQQDRIQLALGADQLPRSFDIRRGEAIALGRSVGPGKLDITLEKLPLAALNWSPAQLKKQGTLAGIASGRFNADINKRTLDGTIAVANPALGQLRGDRLAGTIAYANGVATLTGGTLVQGPNEYFLDAQAINGDDPKLSGRLRIANARMEDLILSYRILQVSGTLPGQDPIVFGNQNDLKTAPIEFSDRSLWEQLQRIAELEELIDQREQVEATSRVPDIEKLTGIVNGEVSFAGTVNTGLQGDFDLRGKDWQAGEYAINEVIAKGNWDRTGFQFEPVQAVSGKQLFAFQGRVGGDRQTGELTVQNVPADAIADLLDLPVDLQGQLNGKATLAGKWNRPAVDGQFTLDNGKLNNAAIDQAQTIFQYRGARLAFNGQAVIGATEPLTVEGTVPFQLPFSDVKPDTDQIDISMNIKDKGLALVNLFTNQVSWVDGRGQLGLKVRGTLDRPLLLGNLVLQEATLRSPSLTEPLTNVNGSVKFDSDRFMVESFTSRLSQGEISARGNLPIFDEKITLADPLALKLNNLALNLKGLYRGQVAGDLLVRGSALSPGFGGIVALRNGQVLLTGATSSLSGAPPAESNTPPSAVEAEATPSAEGSTIKFDDLNVQVQDNVRIIYVPVLSFIAEGNVRLDGTLDAPRPQGRVSFRRGEVNLFTTRFRVDARRQNYAEFTPLYGLDPFLNLSLRTTVTDVISGRKTDLNEFADIQAGSLGAVESVRVRANIQGRASQLATRFGDIVELESTPGRTQGEILALLSGGVAQSLETGDAQGALVNFAGSALFNRVGGFVDDVLGSRASFRLFPVLTPTENRNGSALDLGGELGYDITDRLSVSLQQIVTNPRESPQFTVNYDVNDNWRIRSSVNFEGEAVGVVEYRIRF
jgi:translocation and assembly module TamB